MSHEDGGQHFAFAHSTQMLKTATIAGHLFWLAWRGYEPGSRLPPLAPPSRRLRKTPLKERGDVPIDKLSGSIAAHPVKDRLRYWNAYFGCALQKAKGYKESKLLTHAQRAGKRLGKHVKQQILGLLMRDFRHPLAFADEQAPELIGIAENGNWHALPFRQLQTFTRSELKLGLASTQIIGIADARFAPS
jgi:hypothetical protein